ncbi:MAG TPA: O-antigen ligase family protein [Candidatus Dormibacteraeota bacterium]|nr:O-antigen ligase family protein [Candidatus Dormibacteraeota bacterium]
METARERMGAGSRVLGRLLPPFHLALTATAGLALLVAGAGAILNLRSPKYLGAVIVMSLAGAVFLALPRKFNFFLYAAGFTMPYFVEVILLQRDRATLVVTGTSLVIAVLAIVGVATGVLGKPRTTLEPGITVAMLIFLCACLLSIVNTTDRTLSVMSLLQEAEMLVIFLVLVNAMQDKSHAIIFLRGLYLGFALQCVIYLVQNAVGFSFDVLGNTNRIGATDLETGRIGSQRGTFANAPATAALYFSLMTLSLTGLYLSQKKLSIRLMPLLGMMMGLGCLVLSAKRAPMLGFALALMVMVALLQRRAPGALRRLLPVLGALSLAFLVCLPVFILRAESNHEAALEERVNLTRVAWNMYHANPALGTGFGTYDSVKRAYLPADWSGWLYTVHSRYLLILAETGAVGFSALVLVYLMILRTAYLGIRRIAPEFRPLQISLVAGLVAIFWEQAWDIFNSRQQEYLLWFLAAMAAALPRALSASQVRERA